MPIINLKINYENSGGKDPVQYSLDLLNNAIKSRYNDSLSQDERQEYGGIYKKLKQAPQSGDIDLNKSEYEFIKAVLSSTRTSLDESIDFLKLEQKFK